MVGVLPCVQLRFFYQKAYGGRREHDRGDGPKSDVKCAADWRIWRIVTDPRMSVSLYEVQALWSFEDLIDAHEALDARDEAEYLANKTYSITLIYVCDAYVNVNVYAFRILTLERIHT